LGLGFRVKGFLAKEPAIAPDLKELFKRTAWLKNNKLHCLSTPGLKVDLASEITTLLAVCKLEAMRFD
jgi:hypothetical protein